VALLFGEGGCDENSLVRPIEVRGTLVETPMRIERNGGPEPHAAKNGWIAMRRDRHIPVAAL